MGAFLSTGKTASAENFPVASLLLPKGTRAQVMAFYRFARAADDIADDPALGPEDKLRRLEALAPPCPHAATLLQAFRRDAANAPCRDWDDLMAYCACSAMPVGRFLLDLHGETTGQDAADALCAAHQILNHIQDCRADFQGLRRVYVPADWLAEAGVTAETLGGGHSPPALRAVFGRMLGKVDTLIAQARPLPGLIRSRGLRLQASVTIVMAEKLAELLRRHDPLAVSVRLSPWHKAASFATGIARAL